MLGDDVEPEQELWGTITGLAGIVLAREGEGGRGGGEEGAR